MIKSRAIMPEWLKKSLYYVVALVSILYLIILFSPVSARQPQEVHPLVLEPVNVFEGGNYNYDSLVDLYGKNKNLPKGYEVQALLALSAYPELKNTRISFTVNRESAALEANFKLPSLFGPREERHYDILINNSEGGFLEAIKIQNLPFDGQVAILAHELAHVVYYDRLSIFQLANWGIRYLLFPTYRAHHERSTDLATVWRGLGHQMYTYTYYVRHDESTRELFEQMGPIADLFYMSDQEIKAAMQEMNAY